MYIKHPLERIDYGKDWSDFLLEGEALTEVASFATPSGLLIESCGISGENTIAWISGGTLGKSYRVTFLVTTSTGAIAADSLFIKVDLK